MYLHTILRTSTLESTGAHGLHCNTLQHTATNCNKLQQTATHCQTLQHTAIQHPLERRNRQKSRTNANINVTQRNTLQHTATHP